MTTRDEYRKKERADEAFTRLVGSLDAALPNAETVAQDIQNLIITVLENTGLIVVKR